MKKTLIVDTTSETLKIAIFNGDKILCNISEKGMVLENFFPAIKRALAYSQTDIADIENFYICQGTGSILGIRCASVALNTFKALGKGKVFYYGLFDVLQKLIEKTCDKDFYIACPSRKNFLNVCEVKKNETSKNFEIETKLFEPKDIKVFYIQQRENSAIENFKNFEYDIKNIFEILEENKSLLNEYDISQDALLLTKKEYVKWNSQAHI